MADQPLSGSLWAVPAIATAFVLAACVDDTRVEVGPAHTFVSSGQGIAQRYCGQCHAVTFQQKSPLEDAPPFAQLRTRYSRVRMGQILESRAVDVHPRMPELHLDEDELEQFLIYWETLRRAP